MPRTFQSSLNTAKIFPQLSGSRHSPSPSITLFTRFSPRSRHLSISSSRRFAQPLSEIFHPDMITQPISFPVLSRPRLQGNRKAIPASWMRCGTSKGLFIDRQYLPESPEQWSPWLMAAMGSKGDDVRQLDGIGGATSTTSKVAVVTPSSRPGVDIEYTFAQVAVGKEIVDYSGNCGNIASGVGPFALEQGMVNTQGGAKQIDIHILNTNTNSILVETVALDEYGCYEESGDYRIAGVAGTGSEVKVAFTNPAGTMTGRLFPTGRKEDTIFVRERAGSTSFKVRGTMIDAGNPFVLVDASTLPTVIDSTMLQQPERLPLSELNDIRCKAAVMMGLASNTEQAKATPGTPKLALIFPPEDATRIFLARVQDIPEADVVVLSLSMGKLHPSLQLTGAVAVSSAFAVDGTVPSRLSSRPSRHRRFSEQTERTRQRVCITHRSGSINVTVEARSSNSEVHVQSCSVSRTARTLFEGQVLFRT